MKKMFLYISVLSLVAAGLASANLLDNQGFEDYNIQTTWSDGCDVTNWFGWSNVERVDNAWKTPYEGDYTVVLKNYIGGGGIEQKVSGLTADETYQLRFQDLWDTGMDGTIDVEIRWLNDAWSQIGSNVFNGISLGADDTWNLQNIVVTSITSTARAEINIDCNGGTSGAYYIDDVDFDVVPEPTSVVMLALGLVGVYVYRRKN